MLRGKQCVAGQRQVWLSEIGAAVGVVASHVLSETPVNPEDPNSGAGTPGDVEPVWVDLAARSAGEGPRERAGTLRSAASIRTFLGRILMVKTEERAWRIGAKGEACR